MKCILFDWDGVLADSLTHYFELYQAVSRHFQKPLPIHSPQEFREWYEPRWEENYYEMGFSAEELPAALEWAINWLDYSRVQLFAPVPAMLRRLAAEWPMAIVSTTPSPIIRQRLAKEGLEELFRLVTGGEDGSSEKVEKIDLTLARLGLRHGVMVGDTRLDVEAAAHHGLKTVAATYGWQSPARVLAARPDLTAERPEELEAVVRQALGV
ncbi:MAG: hypothetical protein AMXMBFR33_52840 [Candidatus Xenobia bacterium]